jgi:hypothetical protein
MQRPLGVALVCGSASLPPGALRVCGPGATREYEELGRPPVPEPRPRPVLLGGDLPVPAERLVRLLSDSDFLWCKLRASSEAILRWRATSITSDGAKLRNCASAVSQLSAAGQFALHPNSRRTSDTAATTYIVGSFDSPTCSLEDNNSNSGPKTFKRNAALGRMGRGCCPSPGPF